MNLELLHLCDSLFPIGSFGYSDGLETAMAGLAPDAPDAVDRLREWMDVCLDETIGRLEGPAVWIAWGAVADGDWDRVAAVDAETIALRPSAAARKSTRAMGLQLLTTWSALKPDPRLAHALALARRRGIGPSLPVVFGGVCCTSAIARSDSVEAFAYTRLASTISAAMRLMPIGQTSAHGLLARCLARIPAVVAALIARAAPSESFAPHVDIALMTHQYLHSRLFRT